jgi:hypothetical protein
MVGGMRQCVCIVLQLAFAAASRRTSLQFQNAGTQALDVWWEGGEEAGNVLTYPKVVADAIESGEAFVGHKFFLTLPGQEEKVGESVEVDDESRVYLFKLEGDSVVWTKSSERIAVVSMPARFRNRRNDNLEQYWISGSTWVFQGNTRPKDESGQNVYTTHKFAFCKANDLDNCKKGDHVAIFTIRAEKFIYTVKANEPDEEFEKYAKEEAEFTTAYHKRTGRHWQAIYPRNKPLHPLWPADHVGQMHEIKTKFRKGLCDTSVGAKMIDDHVAGKHIEMRRRMAEVSAHGRRRLIPSGFGDKNTDDIPQSLRGAMGEAVEKVKKVVIIIPLLHPCSTH